MRKCRNWQTSKTKDLVVVTSCGFKSHLPHERLKLKDLSLFALWRKIFFPFLAESGKIIHINKNFISKKFIS